jgi:hypothetical protein|tara:strand:+ start:872 stop:1111 length:240 start_codon:yes stop_codon:yes gene_type:complete
MFRIPSFYQETVDFTSAWNTITNFGRGDALEGMNAMNRVWDEHASGSDRFEDDEDFYEWYEAEVNAYNVVFENMGKLFA